MSLNAEIRVSIDVDLKNYLRMTDEFFESFASFAEASHWKAEHENKRSYQHRRKISCSFTVFGNGA